MPDTADTSFKRPSLRTHPRVRLWRLRQNWPVLVWVLVLGLTFVLFVRSSQFGEMVGVVETIAEPVAPLETARLNAILVRVGQRVKAGDVIAQMDTTLVDAELALEKATMTVQQGTLQSYQTATHSLLRQFDTAIEDLLASLKEQEMLQKRDTAELAELKKIQAQRDDLFRRKLITEVDANELRPQIAGLETSVAAYPEMVSALKLRLERARNGRAALGETLKVGDGGDVLGAIADANRSQAEVLKTTVEMRELERKSYTLRATRDGIVSEIFKVAGDVVSSGTPVVKIVAERPGAVIAFLPEAHLASLSLGETVYVFRQYGTSVFVPAVVETIAPELDTMPMRISPIQGQLQRGRRVVLNLQGPRAGDFVPGETVQVRMIASGWRKFMSMLNINK